PSQSSSRPLQSSGVPVTVPWHSRPPSVHTSTPGSHRPGALHGWPTPGGPSSTRPSQSLSMPSQSSGDGPIWPTHTSPPPLHTTTPYSHWPTSLAPHGPPASPGLSSTRPSQSLSRRSQISSLGPT